MGIRLVIILICCLISSSFAGAALASLEANEKIVICASRRNSGVDGNLMRGVRLFNSRRYKEALICLRKSADAYPSPEAYFYIGKSLYRIGEYEDSIKAYEKGLGILSGYLRDSVGKFFLNEIGLCYYKLDDHRKSIEYLDKAIGQENDIAAFNKIKIYSNLGREEQAFEAYIHFLIRFPRSPRMIEAHDIIDGLD